LDEWVDDEIDGDEWIDLLDRRRAAASRPHRSEIDDARDAREVLQDNAGGLKWDLDLGRSGGLPPGERFNVGLGDA